MCLQVTQTTGIEPVTLRFIRTVMFYIMSSAFFLFPVPSFWVVIFISIMQTLGNCNSNCNVIVIHCVLSNGT